MVFRQSTTNTNYPKEVIMTYQYEVTVTNITFTGEAANEQDALKQTIDFLNESEFVSTFGSVKVIPIPFTLIDPNAKGVAI